MGLGLLLQAVHLTPTQRMIEPQAAGRIRSVLNPPKQPIHLFYGRSQPVPHELLIRRGQGVLLGSRCVTIPGTAR